MGIFSPLFPMDWNEKPSLLISFEKKSTIAHIFGLKAGNELILQAQNNKTEQPFTPFYKHEMISGIPKIIPKNWCTYKQIIFADPEMRPMFAIIPVSTEQYRFLFDRNKINFESSSKVYLAIIKGGSATHGTK